MTIILLPPSSLPPTPVRARSRVYLVVFPDGTEGRRRMRADATHALCVQGTVSRVWFVREWFDERKAAAAKVRAGWEDFFRPGVRLEVIAVREVPR